MRRDPKLPKVVETLRAYVERNGGQVLASTNEFELLRIRTDQGAGVVYTNARGRITYTGEAERCMREMGEGRNIRLTPTKPRRSKSDQVVDLLLVKQDGRCFFCFGSLNNATATIEHLVPVTAGGPSHIANYVLACRLCNQRAGHLSALDKVLMRERAKADAEAAA